MAKKRRKSVVDNLKLTDKTHPWQGIVSVICLVICVWGFVMLCAASSRTKGNGTLFAMGLGGMGCFIVSIAGFVLAVQALRREEIRYLFPNIGAIGNGIMLIIFMLLYGAGIYM